MTTILLSSEIFEISAKTKGKVIVPVPESGISTLAFQASIPSLDNYYTKSETSSASEISGAIANAGKGYTVVVRKLDDQGIGSGWCFVGGNQIEAQAVSLPFGLRIQHVDTSLTETSVYNQSFIVVPNGVNSSGYDTVYVNGVAKNNEVIQLSGDTLVELYYLFCFLEGTLVKLADGTSKPIEDITYDDMLSVWNFDDGHLDAAKPLWINKPSFTAYCWETELSSGKRIRTAGIHGHRFFSLDENKFLYADEIDGHHIWTEDGEDVVTSSKLVQGINARFYNIITDKHINIFADGILAGCSLENGLYPVKDMKFVKDGRQLRDFSEFEGEVSREWFDGCRYAESNLSRKYLINYFQQRNQNFRSLRQPMKVASPTSEPYDISSYINVHGHVLRGLGTATLSDDAIAYQQLQDEVSNVLSTVDNKLEEYAKIVVNTSNVSSSLSTLVINNVTKAEYDSMLLSGTLNTSQLYSIDSLQLDARDDWVVNVKTPELSSDAANKAYVDTQLSNAGGGYAFDIYKPPYDSINNMYVLKPGKFNVLSSKVTDGCVLVLEEYTENQIYKVKLSSDAENIAHISLLVDDNSATETPGAYSKAKLNNRIDWLSPDQAYMFEVSYGNVTINDDYNGDALVVVKPYCIVEEPIDQYSPGLSTWHILPVDNACNYLSTVQNDTVYHLHMPPQQNVNGIRRMRQFKIAVSSHGLGEVGSQLSILGTDIAGQTVTFRYKSDRYHVRAPLSGEVLAFMENKKQTFDVNFEDEVNLDEINSSISSLSNDIGALSSQLSSKQDKLTDAQISAIDEHVHKRATVVTFTDNTVSSYDIAGELTQAIRNSWGKVPKAVKIGTSVTSIGQSAFNNCDSLTSVTIPDSVTSIENYAFYYCINLTDVIIPSSVTNIKSSAFWICAKLSNLTIPDSITCITERSFNNCSRLTSITIPNSVVSIESTAFGNSFSLSNIIIPSNVTSIYSSTFENCDCLTSIIFRDRISSEIPSGAPWGAINATITTWNDASQEWVNEQIPYTFNEVSSTSYALKDQAVNTYTFSGDVSSVTLAFPAADSNFVKDFLLDVTNTTTADAVIELSGLDSQFAVVTKEDDDLVDMTTIAADEMARFYITQTGFQLSGLPTFEISKKKVVGATS